MTDQTMSDPYNPQAVLGQQWTGADGQVWTLMGVHTGAGWGREWVPGVFPAGQVVIDQTQPAEPAPEPAPAADAPDRSRLVVVGVVAGLIVMLGVGFAAGRPAPWWWLAGHTSLDVLMSVSAVGVFAGGVLAFIKLVRHRETPLWTYRKASGRKVHGFLNWWGTLAGLWVVAVFIVWDTVRLAGLLSYLLDIVRMWAN